MEDSQQRLVSTFANHFLIGRSYKTIVEARAEAAVILGELVSPGTPQAKVVDECIEQGASSGWGSTKMPREKPKIQSLDLHELNSSQQSLTHIERSSLFTWLS